MEFKISTVNGSLLKFVARNKADVYENQPYNTLYLGCCYKNDIQVDMCLHMCFKGIPNIFTFLIMRHNHLTMLLHTTYALHFNKSQKYYININKLCVCLYKLKYPESEHRLHLYPYSLSISKLIYYQLFGNICFSNSVISENSYENSIVVKVVY